MCAVATTTCLAAFSVSRVTIHRLFQLAVPIEHEGKPAMYWSLPKISQKVMKTKLRNVKLINVDGISIVSSLNLTYMHTRLEELFGNNEWFGSIQKCAICSSTTTSEWNLSSQKIT